VGQAAGGQQLAPGTRLREEPLARSFSVSRTPVREALILLSASGLAHLEPNRGAMVLQLTAEDVSEVYHLRAVLESESAAMAAGRITPEVAALLFKICDRMADTWRTRACSRWLPDASAIV
jgi:DNA-binding GntR family transcriptional regulator